MRVLLFILLFALGVAAQMPPIEPGVSHDLAIWRAAHYSDVRYKLNLTLEKMSPVLKGAIEIRVNVEAATDGKAVALALAGIPKDEALRLIKDLESQMRNAAKQLEFEKAAQLRDQIIEIRRSMIE